MTVLEVLQLVGNIAGIGALGVFMLLGYKVFQQSVARSQEIDDETIADLRTRLDDSYSREDALRARQDELEERVNDLSDQFTACKRQLAAVQAYLKLNFDIDPDHI